MRLSPAEVPLCVRIVAHVFSDRSVGLRMVCNGIAGRHFNTLAPMASNCEAEKTIDIIVAASHATNSTFYNADHPFQEDSALRRRPIVNLIDNLRAYSRPACYTAVFSVMVE